MSKTRFKPELAVNPTSTVLAPGASLTFDAEINYPEGVRTLRQPVRWSVQEPEGGSINPAGLYMAPGDTGTFHVQAQREDYPELVVTATVTVR